MTEEKPEKLRYEAMKLIEESAALTNELILKADQARAKHELLLASYGLGQGDSILSDGSVETRPRGGGPYPVPPGVPEPDANPPMPPPPVVLIEDEVSDDANS